MTTLWRSHIGALVIFIAIAATTLDHGASLTSQLTGQGSDRYIFIWFLAWWPWAIVHHASMLHTNLVWQPLGVFTFWVTSIPLLSLIFAPVTLLAGPITAYNLLCLAGPVLAAFIAYCLCLRLTKHPEAAIFGGALFGFSPYEVAHAANAPNLGFSACVPAAFLLALLRLQNRIGRRIAVTIGAANLVAQFLISAEIFATLVLVSGLALLFAYASLPDWRHRLARLGMDAALSSFFACIILSPCLLSMLTARHYAALPAFWPYFFAADLETFFIPAPPISSGGFTGLVQLHRGLVAESYLGLPILAIFYLFARQFAGQAEARLLTFLVVVVAILSLGSDLWVAGHDTGLALPWRVAVHVPLLTDILPSRFALYVTLSAAIVTSLWLAASPSLPRRLLVLLACAAWWPARPAWTPIPHTVFFQPGRIAETLGPGRKLLILPFATVGPAMLWQVQSGFAFRQTGGYLGYPPSGMQTFPAVAALYGGAQPAGFIADLAQFCVATGTDDIVAGPGTPAALSAALTQLHWPSRTVDDVMIYQVPGATNG
jgi:hypothetical protein